jgi:hypothetical protein
VGLFGRVQAFVVVAAVPLSLARTLSHPLSLQPPNPPQKTDFNMYTEALKTIAKPQFSALFGA